jgi:hypothetical protein
MTTREVFAHYLMIVRYEIAARCADEARGW